MARTPEEIKADILRLTTEYYEAQFKGRNNQRIDPSGKSFDDKELQYGIEAILDSWWTEERYSKEFKKRLSDYLGVKNTILVNSGSSANLTAFYALTSSKLNNRIKPGDEIITTATGFPTTISPIVQAGAIPVFVDIEDIDKGTYNIDTKKIEEAITEKTKAIMVAHTLGNPINLEEIMRIKEKYNLWLIEDCCDALGSKYNNQFVGTFGDLATLSFYPAHHITMGEGGAVLTNNNLLKKLAESFRNWGRDCWCEPGKDDSCKKRYSWQLGLLPQGYDHKNTYTHLGFNLKLTDMQAAIGLAQFDKLEGFIDKRKFNFSFFRENLKKYKEYLILPNATENSDPSWFGFLITVKNTAPFKKEDLVNFLESKNIGSRALFAGNITKHPAFERVNYRVVGDLKNSDKTTYNTFWIGVQPNIGVIKREYVLKAFDEFFKKY